MTGMRKVFGVLAIVAVASGGMVPSAIWAEGGGPPATPKSGSSTTDTPKPKSTKPKPKATSTGASSTGTGTTTKSTTASKAPAAKPPCFKYRQSKIRKIRDVQTKLAGYAKKYKLKGLATNLKRLENFARQMDAMGQRYSGWKSVQFNLIYTQMQCYANQKVDKELRKWARGILQALAVIKERDHVAEKRAKWRKAKEEKNPIKTAIAEAEYSDARGDYHRAARKLPKEIKALFKPAPKRPGG